MDEDKLSIFPSNKQLFAAAIAAGAIACVGPAALAQQGAPMIAIEKMDVGAAPADFDFGLTGQGRPGQWAVTADATGGRAIEQKSADELRHLHQALPQIRRDQAHRMRGAGRRQTMGAIV